MDNFTQAQSEQLHQLLTLYPEGLNGSQWNFRSLSSRDDLPSAYVRNHLDKDWDHLDLLINKNLDLEVKVEYFRYLITEGIPLSDVHQLVSSIAELPLLKMIVEEYNYSSCWSIIYFNKRLQLEAVKWLISLPQAKKYRIDITEILLNNINSEVIKWSITNKYITDLNQIICYHAHWDNELLELFLADPQINLDSLSNNYYLTEDQMITIVDQYGEGYYIISQLEDG